MKRSKWTRCYSSLISINNRIYNNKLTSEIFINISGKFGSWKFLIGRVFVSVDCISTGCPSSSTVAKGGAFGLKPPSPEIPVKIFFLEMRNRFILTNALSPCNGHFRSYNLLQSPFCGPNFQLNCHFNLTFWATPPRGQRSLTY